MPKVTLQPEGVKVFNELDQQGLLLALDRIRNEKNPEYKRRLMDVMVNRANSTYRGLINGITRELGLSIEHAITIKTLVDVDDVPLAADPAVVFQGTKFLVYENYSDKELILELDRFQPSGGSFTIQEIVDQVNATGKYTATIQENIDPKQRAMTCFNQSSIVTVTNEDISSSGIRVRLENNNLIKDTVSVSSQNLLVRKSTSNNLKAGEYYIDLTSGTVFSAQVPALGSVIRYKYRQNVFKVYNSPVIIHDIQSDEFRSKMFQQVCDDLGVECNGLPTPLGADIINELLSVYPFLWGS